ncbi:MAG: hypothetical protein JW942_09915 [Opitutales bacterium]|nr:hypothetical protein [Opitutales bacterium]
MTRKSIALLLAATFPCVSQAALSLNIDSYTTSEITLTIGGTLDSDVVGDQKNWIAIKNDWTNNYGVNTDWFETAPTCVHSLKINNTDANVNLNNSTSYYADAVYFSIDSNDLLAGYSVSGSITLTGSFIELSAVNLELLSGFDNTAKDWARLEASASVVPEPAQAGAALGLAALGAIVLKRRRKA